MTVTSVLVLPGGTRGADTSDEPLTAIAGAPPATFYDVAWNFDGTAAVFVGWDTGGTGTGCLYWYDPADGTWEYLFHNGGVDDPHSDTVMTVAWDHYNSEFVALGICESNGYWYSIDADRNLYEAMDAELANVEGHDLIFDSYNNRMLCAGFKSSPYGATCFAYSVTTHDWTILFYNGDEESSFTGVAIDPMTQYVYAVGTNYPSMWGLYYRWAGTLEWVGQYGYGSEYGDLLFSDIVWHQSTGAMVLSVEARASGEPGILYAYGPDYNVLNRLGEEWEWQMHYQEMAVDSSGTIIAVGYADYSPSIYGRVYTVWRDSYTGSWHIAQTSIDGAYMLGHDFSSVSIRPARIPMALIAGSAFVYHYTSADSGVQVNVVAPHINFIDVYGAGTSTSYVNSPVDIDDGSNTVGYDVTLSAYHSAGQGYITNVELSLWRDTGASESMPAGTSGTAARPTAGP